MQKRYLLISLLKSQQSKLKALQLVQNTNTSHNLHMYMSTSENSFISFIYSWPRWLWLKKKKMHRHPLKVSVLLWLIKHKTFLFYCSLFMTMGSVLLFFYYYLFSLVGYKFVYPLFYFFIKSQASRANRDKKEEKFVHLRLLKKIKKCYKFLDVISNPIN